ncbi:uncharacterized protein LOC6498844 isoform X1 [Drosophila ananassae]|nr:uncharacterized protein LOC6498844 isoform X1 [Drosophila ananassae]
METPYTGTAGRVAKFTERATPDCPLRIFRTGGIKSASPGPLTTTSPQSVTVDKSSIAIYSATSRGRMQLIYGGQPFIFEKTLKLSSGEEKRFWRCNQWWNQKCRSRVFTINDVVCPLNRFHTHEEIVRRKKRVRRVPPVETISKVAPTARQQPHQPDQHQHQPQQQEIQLTSDAMLTTTLEDESPATIDVSELGMHLKYEEIVADVTGIVGGATRVVSRRK